MAFTLEDYVIDGTGAIKVLDGWRLLELDEANIYGGADPYSDEGIAKFKAWSDANYVYCYSRTKENFFEFEAYELAEKADASYLIMENLS